MYKVRTYRTRARAEYVRRTASIWKIRVRNYYAWQQLHQSWIAEKLRHVPNR